MNEIEAKQIVFANIKRKKRKKDLVTIARALDWLVRHRGSRAQVAGEFGLSTEMIRQFLTVLKLPPEVQKLFHDRTLDSVDVAKEIATLRDRDKQIHLAHRIGDAETKDTRDIKRLVKQGGTEIDDAKRTILGAKERGLHVFLVDFDDDTFRLIKERSRKAGVEPAEFVRRIVLQAVRNQAENDNSR